MNRNLTAGLALLLAAAAAQADTTCRLTSGASLAFGLYDPVSAVANDSLARVSAVCSRNGGPRDVSITLQVGQCADGDCLNNCEDPNRPPGAPSDAGAEMRGA